MGTAAIEYILPVVLQLAVDGPAIGPGTAGKLPVLVVVALADALQPFALVTVTVNVATVFTLMVCVVAPVLHK